MTCCLENCESPTAPDDPSEPPVKYDLEMTYTRTGARYSSYLFVSPSIDLFLVNKNGVILITSNDFLTRIDDYHFTCEFSGIFNNDSKSIYCLHMMDMAKWDGFNSDSAMVGKKIVIKVKQTGFETELKDIRKSNFSFNPNHGEKARIACFVLTREGTIISNAQSSY